MYKTIIFYLFFLLPINLSAQLNQKSILIYSEGSGFLQPFIETTIRELKNTKFNDAYFEEVNSLNTYISDNKYQAFLRDLIGTQKPANVMLGVNYSEDETEIRTRIFNILTDYDYFLTIKTNTLGELIEFQFQLFQTIKSPLDSKTKNAPLNISDKVLNVEDFFINPKAPNYCEEIKNAIQRLFVYSNIKPIAELRLFDNVVKSNERSFIPLGSTVILDGSNSGDYDSQNIKYLWRNISRPNEKIQTTNKINFKENKSIQEILVEKEGDYIIGFKVFDGIDYSDEIVLLLSTLIKPKISVYDTIVYSVDYKSLLNKTNFKKNFLSNKSYFYNSSWYTNFKNKFVLSTQKLGNKFNKEKQSSLLDTTFIIEPIKNDTIFKGLIIRSKFGNFKLDNKRRYYFYNIAPFDLLSDEVSITHKLIQRKVFNIYIKGGYSAIPFIKYTDGSKEGGYTWYPNFSCGVYLTKNIEIELGASLIKTKPKVYQQKQIFVPALFTSSLKYHIFYKNNYSIKIMENFYLGLTYKIYKTNSDNKIFFENGCYGLVLGYQRNIISKEKFQMDILTEFTITRFTNNNIPTTFEAGQNIGLAFRF